MGETDTENSSAPEYRYLLRHQWGSGSNCEAGVQEGCFLRTSYLALDITILPILSPAHGYFWGGILCCALSHFLCLADGLLLALWGLAFCWLLFFVCSTVSLAKTAFDETNYAPWTLWSLWSGLGLVSTKNALFSHWASVSRTCSGKGRTQRIMGDRSSSQKVWI